jgi:hypothetical protein
LINACKIEFQIKFRLLGIPYSVDDINLRQSPHFSDIHNTSMDFGLSVSHLDFSF